MVSSEEEGTPGQFQQRGGMGLAVNLALTLTLGQTSPERGSVVSSGEGGLCSPGLFPQQRGGGAGGLAVNLGLDLTPGLGIQSQCL